MPPHPMERGANCFRVKFSCVNELVDLMMIKLCGMMKNLIRPCRL